jgi:hypothetical protein
MADSIDEVGAAHLKVAQPGVDTPKQRTHMTARLFVRSTVTLVAVLLPACSLAARGREPQQGFFERADPGGARCYSGASIALGGEERIARDSTEGGTVYMVIDTIRMHDGRRMAHIVGSTLSTNRIGAIWSMAGDSLFMEEWGVMPATDYMLHESGDELTGRAWMLHDTASCINGVCRGARTSHWRIQARRIPCAQVPHGDERS